MLTRPFFEISAHPAASTDPESPLSPWQLERLELQAGPLSQSQQRFLLAEKLGPPGLYNESWILHIQGELDPVCLRRSLTALTSRHESLRTRIDSADPEWPQIICPPAEFELEIVDFRGESEPTHRAQSRRRLIEHCSRPFDFQNEALFRAVLLLSGARDAELLLVTHHLVCDGWSRNILVEELAQLYSGFSRGGSNSLPGLPVQYLDYAVWESGWISSPAVQSQLNYWRQQLRQLPPLLSLPSDRSRPRTPSGIAGRLAFELAGETHRELRALARRERVTLFMLLAAAVMSLLSRLTRTSDVVIGTAVAGRVHADCDRVIGCFVNSLALRTDLSGNPEFCELLQRVRRTVLDACEHQDIPFDTIVADIQPERDLSHQLLYSVMLLLQDARASTFAVPGGTWQQREWDIPRAKADLMLNLFQGSSAVHGTIDYATDLFDLETVHRFGQQLQRLLEDVTRRPRAKIAELRLLSAAQRHQLVVQWNQTSVPYPREHCIHELFEQQVRHTPQAVALIYQDQRISYGELDERSNQVGHRLSALGVGPEGVVGLCMDRSIEMVVGLLGILKAGGAYLPLDANDPASRLRYVLSDAGARVLLVQSSLGLDHLEEAGCAVICLDSRASELQDYPRTRISSGACPDNLAYVMYTSGSTGTPKGVAAIHRNVVRLVRETDYVDLSAREVMLHLAPLCFDASTFEIWGALLNGAQLVLYPSGVANSARVKAALREHQVSVLWLTAGLFHQLVDEQLEGFAGVRQMLAGGDVLSASHVRRVLERHPGCRVINGYGPTECVTFSVCGPVQRVGLTERVPIGRPIANTRVYVLDDSLQPVPIGGVGELYIAGDGLARGYLGRPELTAERFPANPFGSSQGERFYRTGDLVRLRADGNLEFIGRVDQQVKLRGYRIELGEIEAALLAHPRVAQAVAVVRQYAADDQRLVAYVVERDATPAVGILEGLRLRLPAYMVPAVIVSLAALPLTSGGKVDRRRLPAPGGRPQLAAEYLAPRTPLETVMAAIWSEVLQLDHVGIHDNFFALGGHSLLGARVVSRTRALLEIDLPLHEIFQAPTVQTLCERIEQRAERGGSRTETG